MVDKGETEVDKDVYKAKIAEQAERYDEMVIAMKKIAKCQKSLTVEERNLLSVAYKNVIGARRASWRVLSTLEERLWQEMQRKGGETEGKNSSRMEIIKKYKEVVEEELKSICTDVLTLLKEYLIDNCKSEDVESKVFYHKMRGDYLRYKAEFCKDTERSKAAEDSLAEYKKASDLAKSGLPPTNAIRLGLALNFSVFYYEILNSPDRACHLAKLAFDEAIEELEKLEDESYKDSTLIMQLLRDNLTLWTSDMKPEGEKEDTTVQDLEDQEAS